MTVCPGPAVAWYMLDNAADSASLKAIQHGLAERRDDHWFGAEAAVADDVVAALVTHVEQGQAIDIDAQIAQQRGQRQRVEPARLDGRDRRLFVQFSKHFAGREFGPVRRPQARNAAAFLIDQDRQIAPGQIAQRSREGAQLIGRFHVAFEQDIAGRVAAAEQRPLVVRQGGAGQAEDQRLHHFFTTSQAPFSASTAAQAAAGSAAWPRSRHSVLPWLLVSS